MTTLGSFRRLGSSVIAAVALSGIAVGCSSSSDSGATTSPPIDAAAETTTTSGDSGGAETSAPGDSAIADSGNTTTDSSAASDLSSTSDDATSDATGTDTATASETAPSVSDDSGATETAAVDAAPAACPTTLPGAPPTTFPAGSARGDFGVGGPPAHYAMSSAVFVPIDGSSYYELVVSDDPDLCTTLKTNNQATGCSLAPGSGGHDVTPYRYVAGTFAYPSIEGAASESLPFYEASPRIDSVGVPGAMKIEDPITSSSNQLRGEMYACDESHGVAISGVFSATRCVGGKPICF